MKVLAILALLIGSLWCLQSFIPGLFITVGGILALAGKKQADDGIDKFWALVLCVGVVAGIVILAN